MEPLVSKTSASQDLDPANIYHIYHSGRNDVSYAIHTVSDSKTTLNLELNRTVSGADAGKPAKKSFLTPSSTLSNVSKRMKRAKAYDKPEHDPRTETSPYFVHLPVLLCHSPPYTLRRGGKKTAPTACLMHSLAFWRGWKLEFGDVLAQDGVIDGRGVVGLNYGTEKGQDGTLKGYKVRKRRYWGESGKAWFKEQKARPKLVDTEVTAKAKPEEVVLMRWSSPFSFHPREYNFDWRGIKFVWKGTTKVNTRTMKFLRPFLRFNHLKLIAIVPGGMEGEKQIQEVKIPLADFVSVAGKRKSGRLEVYPEGIECLVSEHMDIASFKPEAPSLQEKSMTDEKVTATKAADTDDAAKIRERLRDLIVASGMCMIIGEFQKRQLLIQLILLAADGAGN